MNRVPVFVVALVATTAYALTIAGHPVPNEFAAGSGISYTSASFPISDVVFDRCNGTSETITYNQTLDPAAGDDFVVPPGRTCGAEIELSGPVTVSGEGNGATFSLTLNVGTVYLDVVPEIEVPPNGSGGATALVLADTDWVTDTLLDLDPGEHVVVGPSHSLHDTLRDAVRNDSELY